MKFSIKYALAFVLLFLLELGIALYVHDDFIRPFVGDVLVVILLYFLLRVFIARPSARLPFYLFLFAAAVEVGQYFQLVHLLGLEHNTVLRIALGSTFDFADILCYFVGYLILLFWQKKEQRG